MEKRNSSIELIKIIAIVVIVLSHASASAPACAGEGDFVIFNVVRTMLTNLGQIGNCLFIIASTWFLIDSTSVRLPKISLMIIEAVVISLGCMVTIVCFGYDVSYKEMLLSVFPLTFGYYWFITCYILLYLIHPYINVLIHGISQYHHFCIACCMFVIYCIVGFLLGGKLYYYNEFVGFIVIYFIISYYKKYVHDKINANKVLFKKILVVCFVIWSTSTFVVCYYSSVIPLLSNKMLWFNSFINPCFIFISLSVFVMSLHSCYFNRKINYLSSLTLLVFMLHNNKLVRSILEIDFYNTYIPVFNQGKWYLMVSAYFIVSLILSFFIGALLFICFKGRLCTRFSNLLASKIDNYMCEIFEKVK